MALDYNDLRQVKGNPSAEVVPGRRLKINPGQDYPYDMPKELIHVVAEKFPVESMVNPESGDIEEFLTKLGQDFMRFLISQADSDAYRDRTAEMIELAAQQTGIRFPHCFERYVELGILTLRPQDTWTVTEATTRKLTVRSYNCTLHQLFAGKGITNCHPFCLAACQVAALKSGVNLQMARTKNFAADGFCQLDFSLQREEA